MCGASAGTAIVSAAPSRQVLPVSPLPENTLMPDAAADCRIVSMLFTSAGLVWFSQYAQLLLMTVTSPSLSILLNTLWKLAPAPGNAELYRMTCAPGANVMTASMSSSTSLSAAPKLAPAPTLTMLRLLIRLAGAAL